MPKTTETPNMLRAAAKNLTPPHDISNQQYAQRVAVAQAQATIALAEQQARTADALETANLIAYLAIAGNSETAAIPVPVNVLKSVQADVETRLGLA